MDIPILPALDIAILAVPFLAILGMAMVGLDERYANPGRRPGARRCFCEVDDRGGSLLSDPDGRLWFTSSSRVIEGELAGHGPRGGKRPLAGKGPERARRAALRSYMIEK